MPQIAGPYCPHVCRLNITCRREGFAAFVVRDRHHTVKHQLQVVRQQPTDAIQDRIDDLLGQRLQFWCETGQFLQQHGGIGAAECSDRHFGEVVDRPFEAVRLHERVKANGSTKNPRQVRAACLADAPQPVQDAFHTSLTVGSLEKLVQKNWQLIHCEQRFRCRLCQSFNL